ncbi:hypothetical protein HK104_009797 [Borealophlyctis nickersoniae]|nr:hypothetical protein HK104_009797 [Borealophlyctis nickersoniae]
MKVLFLILSTITSLVAAAAKDFDADQIIQANTTRRGPGVGGYMWVPLDQFMAQREQHGIKSLGLGDVDVCLTRVKGDWKLGTVRYHDSHGAFDTYGVCETQSGPTVYQVNPAIAGVWVLEIEKGRTATWVDGRAEKDPNVPQKFGLPNYAWGPELGVSVCEVCEGEGTSCTVGYRDKDSNNPDGCSYVTAEYGTGGSTIFNMLLIGKPGSAASSPVPPTSSTSASSGQPTSSTSASSGQPTSSTSASSGQPTITITSTSTVPPPELTTTTTTFSPPRNVGEATGTLPRPSPNQ